MTATASPVLGRPLWYELMTTDMKAAEKFYKTVVGWTSAPFDGAPQPYTMFNRNSRHPRRRRDESSRGDERAALLGDVRRRARSSKRGSRTSSVWAAASCRR